ncbi:30S ribosomal protein THX [Ekhidna sp.]
MGKGDIKTRRGKISKGTYGVTRPRSANKKSQPVAPKKSTKKK